MSVIALTGREGGKEGGRAAQGEREEIECSGGDGLETRERGEEGGGRREEGALCSTEYLCNREMQPPRPRTISLLYTMTFSNTTTHTQAAVD